jgi:hypothetical protein
MPGAVAPQQRIDSATTMQNMQHRLSSSDRKNILRRRMQDTSMVPHMQGLWSSFHAEKELFRKMQGMPQA